MSKSLQFLRQGHEPTRRYKFGRHVIWFKDGEGNTYRWVPKWDDIRNFYLVAGLTEVLNEGQYEQLARFVHASSQVIKRAIEVATERISGIDLREGVDLSFLEEVLKGRGPR